MQPATAPALQRSPQCAADSPWLCAPTGKQPLPETETIPKDVGDFRGIENVPMVPLKVTSRWGSPQRQPLPTVQIIQMSCAQHLVHGVPVALQRDQAVSLGAQQVVSQTVMLTLQS